MDENTLTESLIALEQERCRCIVEQRYDRLAQLLSERLVHTHTRGNFDNKSSYLQYVGGLIESVELRRLELRVIPLSDSAALMHGKQLNRARKRGTSDELTIESTVTQTWVREPDDQWRMAAFHASTSGPLPPPVK